MVRIGKKTLKTSSGKTVHFKSGKALEKYERYNQALKHGWRPTKKKR